MDETRGPFKFGPDDVERVDPVLEDALSVGPLVGSGGPIAVGSDGPTIVPKEFPYPRVGDQISREGYVRKLRVDTTDFYPADLAVQLPKRADVRLELETELAATISTSPDSDRSLTVYRLLYQKPSPIGEELAARVLVAASLKDALLSKTKVLIRGHIQNYEVKGYATPPSSTQYRSIESVELLA